jgi:hydrogenase expression/formation protein HypE
MYEKLIEKNVRKLVLAVPEKKAEKTLNIMKSHPLGKDAQIIGKAMKEYKGKVILKSPYGSKRILEPPAGELLPRIC